LACLPSCYRPYSLSIYVEMVDVERVMDWKKLLAYITSSVDAGTPAAERVSGDGESHPVEANHGSRAAEGGA